MVEKPNESREPEREFGLPWGVEEYERKMQESEGKGKSAVPGRRELEARLGFYRRLLYGLIGFSIVLQFAAPVVWAMVVWAPTLTKVRWEFWPVVYLLLAVGMSKYFKYTYVVLLYFSMAQILVTAILLLKWVIAGTSDIWGYLWVAQRLIEWAYFFVFAKFLFQTEVREMFKELEPEL